MNIDILLSQKFYCLWILLKQKKTTKNNKKQNKNQNQNKKTHTLYCYICWWYKLNHYFFFKRLNSILDSDVGKLLVDYTTPFIMAKFLLKLYNILSLLDLFLFLI